MIRVIRPPFKMRAYSGHEAEGEPSRVCDLSQSFQKET